MPWYTDLIIFYEQSGGSCYSNEGSQAGSNCPRFLYCCCQVGGYIDVQTIYPVAQLALENKNLHQSFVHYPLSESLFFGLKVMIY